MTNEGLTYEQLQNLIAEGGSAIRNLKYAQDKAEQYKVEVKNLMQKHDEKVRVLMDSIIHRNRIIQDLWDGRTEDYEECSACHGSGAVQGYDVDPVGNGVEVWDPCPKCDAIGIVKKGERHE